MKSLLKFILLFALTFSVMSCQKSEVFEQVNVTGTLVCVDNPDNLASSRITKTLNGRSREIRKYGDFSIMVDVGTGIMIGGEEVILFPYGRITLLAHIFAFGFYTDTHLGNIRVGRFRPPTR